MSPKGFLLLVSFFLVGALSAQKPYETSKVYDSIPVPGTKDESFALYLPHSYSTEKLSAVVFILEPAARGVVGIEAFIPASEKYGHILICSNNSKNGPYERNFDIANNLFGHIFKSFNIKADEMYISGFSGGSRLASAIASLTNKFAGVIGCGAGFTGLQEHLPAAHDYAYIGLCGDRDMNYKEMLENKEYLNLIGFKSTLITYDGIHSWPPKEQIVRAFDWLYLQKSKKNGDQELVSNQYQKDLEQLKLFHEKKQLLFAAEQLERMVIDYQNEAQGDSLARAYKDLVKSKALKKKLAAVEEAVELEKKLVKKLDAQLLKDFEMPEKTNFSWWEKELEKLEKFEVKDDPEFKKMVYRVKFDLFARVYSRQNALLHQQTEAQSKLIPHLLKLINPN